MDSNKIRNEVTEGALSDGEDFKVGCLIAFINHHLQIGKSFHLVHTTFVFLLTPKGSPEGGREPGYERAQPEGNAPPSGAALHGQRAPGTRDTDCAPVLRGTGDR